MPMLFSYKIKHDTGFAPNPFWGILTLATCKPQMRRTKRIGDWIAGFTSKALCKDPVGQEKLVYLMEITDKLSIADYFSDQRFERKKPPTDMDECVHKAGDNIYRPLSLNASTDDDFEQLKNKNHKEKDKHRDISGKFVLISDRFFYFGRNPLVIPDNIRPKVPKGQSSQGVRTDNQKIIEEFINFVSSHHDVGVHAAPHDWPNNDQSWKMA